MNFYFLLIGLFISTVLRGQFYQKSINETTNPKQHLRDGLADKESNLLSKKLKLDNDQYIKILAINRHYYQAYDQVINEYLVKNDAKTAEQRLKALDYEKDDKLKILLTAKQWDIYWAKRAYLKEKFSPMYSLK